MDTTLNPIGRWLGMHCTICQRRPMGAWTVSLRDEVTCAQHPVSVRCVFCSLPHVEPRPAGWQPFFGSLLRCTACTAEAVETQAQARTHLPAIRRQMAEIGVTLPDRVRVRIISPDDIGDQIRQPRGGVLLGLTDQLIDAERTTVTGIRIVAGLTSTHFGRAVAHEVGHAWLALHGRAPVRDPAVEEGLCELFAHAWLKHQPTHLAGALRGQLLANPDPVYGYGFRRVRAAVEQSGITAVLDRLLRRGELS